MSRLSRAGTSCICSELRLILRSTECTSKPFEIRSHNSYRLQLAFRENTIFHHKISAGKVCINDKPVLCAVEQAARLQAALSFCTCKMDAFWRMLHMSWGDIGLGPPNIISHGRTRLL